MSLPAISTHTDIEQTLNDVTALMEKHFAEDFDEYGYYDQLDHELIRESLTEIDREMELLSKLPAEYQPVWSDPDGSEWIQVAPFGFDGCCDFTTEDQLNLKQRVRRLLVNAKIIKPNLSDYIHDSDVEVPARFAKHPKATSYWPPAKFRPELIIRRYCRVHFEPIREQCTMKIVRVQGKQERSE